MKEIKVKGKFVIIDVETGKRFSGSDALMKVAKEFPGKRIVDFDFDKKTLWIGSQSASEKDANLSDFKSSGLVANLIVCSAVKPRISRIKKTSPQGLLFVPIQTPPNPKRLAN